MIDIRGYVMHTKLLLDQERAQSIVMGIGDSRLHAGVVLAKSLSCNDRHPYIRDAFRICTDQERAHSFVMGIGDSSLHAGVVLDQEPIVQ